jgi:hypothetical protein
MLVRLITKLAETLDGIDVSQCEEGSLIDLSEREAQLLIAEGWAEPVGRGGVRRYTSAFVPDRAIAADDGALPPARRSAGSKPNGTEE